MKKITVKVMTISSQLLVVSLFLALLFSGEGNNDKVVTVNNNNFDKMADSTSILFSQEEMLTNLPSDSVVVDLDDEIEEIEEENKSDDVEEITEPAPTKVEEQLSTSNTFSDCEVISTYVGTLTGYGADCYGCSGRTSSGFDLSTTMYYDDYEFGTVRILAADSTFPFYSIFRVKNVPGMDDFIAIVLDRGGNVGFGKGTLFDLAFSTESDPNLLSLTNNVTFELLRSGN